MKHDSENIDELVSNHSPDNIRQRLESKPEPSFLSDFIYGAIDGTVTTFALISGVAGAGFTVVSRDGKGVLLHGCEGNR